VDDPRSRYAICKYLGLVLGIEDLFDLDWVKWLFPTQPTCQVLRFRHLIMSLYHYEFFHEARFQAASLATDVGSIFPIYEI
jgi:hypothetical protein